jgi:ABC-2 type transport system permease protein
MFSVFKAQWMKDKRNPITIILFIVLSIFSSIIIGNNLQNDKKVVGIFSTEANASEVEEKWESLLNKSEAFKFVITNEETALKDVAKGEIDVAIKLLDNDYRVIAVSEMPTVQFIEQYVHTVFLEEAQIAAVLSTQGDTEVRSEVKRYLEQPPLQLKTQSVDGKVVPNHNMATQLLFGFTLFLSMFTIGFKVNGVTVDKASGIWNRMILSPVSKFGMYSGHLLYSFCVGFFQILVVFLVFRYLTNFELGNHFSLLIFITAVYTFSTVSMAMLFTGVLKTPEQFNSIYLSIIPAIPILSGVYFPPGTISNSIILFIADLFPLTHAMDAMMSVALSDGGWNTIAFPTALMILIGVLCMGAGINMVERRR